MTNTEDGVGGTSGQKLDIEWKCDNSSGCERLVFTVHINWYIQYVDPGTFKHEWKHVDLMKSYLHQVLDKTLVPAEQSSYKTFFACKDGALAAKATFWKEYNPQMAWWYKHKWHDVTDPGHHGD